MTDKDLIELAAKAAGYTNFEWEFEAVFPRIYNPLGFMTGWNPLTDDGDALRLAVKLDLCVGFDKDPVNYVVFVRKFDDSILVEANIFESIKSDPDAATRRAIVRAAAEIGKAMP